VTLTSISNTDRILFSIFSFIKMLAGAESCSVDAPLEFNSGRGVSDAGCPALSCTENTIFTLFLSKLLNRDDGN